MSDQAAPAADTPKPAGPPQNPPLPVRQAIPYMLAAVVIAVSQGLSQGMLSVNVPQIAGDLGVTQTQATWLLAAYMIPRGAMPLALIKIRTQFGLRRFAEIGIALYVLIAFAGLWAIDFRSAVVLQFFLGVSSSSLSTLAFLYMLEPLAPAWKMRLGLPMVMTFITTGPLLARIVSPTLIGDGGLMNMHLLSLGLAMICLTLVYRLPLRPVPHMKVIEAADFISFTLIFIGISGLTIAFVMGPIYYWVDAPWIGSIIAGAVGSLAIAVIIELNRARPIIDVRWLASPAMLHLAFTLFLFRLLLSEQSSGAPRMFQVLGLANAQMEGLFTVIVLATLMGGLACIAWIKITRVPMFHLIALILIAAGAWMDSYATVLTRPHEMFISQALIAFAGMLFLPSAMMNGLIAALSRGPQYILSFVVIFIATQSIGGIAGSGLFTTIINNRVAVHTHVLGEELQTTSAPTAQAVASRAAAMTASVGDPTMRQAQAVSMISQDVTQQATVLAYNDAYKLTSLAAMVAAIALLLHMVRDAIAARLTAKAAAKAPSQPETAS
ncbi:MAG: MFS transporter [Paracoccus denitrificans]|nr:MAG: MFS transporter [Paracoccus denitrificans]PZO83050.1 MAG: MFS transporter [Paracoccus denitrificans]